MAQICKVHAVSDAQGIFHIDLSGFRSGIDADLTVIVETESDKKATTLLPKGRFSRFSGAIKRSGDPLAIQQELRNEW